MFNNIENQILRIPFEAQSRVTGRTVEKWAEDILNELASGVRRMEQSPLNHIKAEWISSRGKQGIIEGGQGTRIKYSQQDIAEKISQFAKEMESVGFAKEQIISSMQFMGPGILETAMRMIRSSLETPEGKKWRPRAIEKLEYTACIRTPSLMQRIAACAPNIPFCTIKMQFPIELIVDEVPEDEIPFPREEKMVHVGLVIDGRKSPEIECFVYSNRERSAP